MVLSGRAVVDRMLKHVVMWTLNDPSDAATFAAELATCVDLVPGMRAFEVGVKTEALEGNCDVVLVSAFDDAAALAAYLSHPHHERVGATLGKLRKSRVVLDYHVDTPSTIATDHAASGPRGSGSNQGDWE